MNKKAIITVSGIFLFLIFVWIFSSSDDYVISGKQNNPIKPSSNIELKVYIENSGSMNGYMEDGSQMRDALYDYLTDIKNNVSEIELNYINTETKSYQGTLENYLTIRSLKAAGGSTNNTDLPDMIRQVLNNATDTTVCIFVSDCILDLPTTNTKDFFINSEIKIKDAVNTTRKRVPNLAVEIFKMKSTFTGTYFYPNGGKEQLEKTDRPYYIWIFGTNGNLSVLNSSNLLSILKKRGLEEIVSFTSPMDVPYDVTNAAGTQKVAKAVRDKYKIRINADFSGTLLSEKILTSPDYYETGGDKIKIESINPIEDKNSNYTHTILISIPKNQIGSAKEIILDGNKSPKWLESTNDDTGREIKKNIKKTTGIKYLIDGVKDAYATNTYSTKMEVTFTKK